MTRRSLLIRTAAAAAALTLVGAARAEDAVKIGVILPMTGPSASTGRQIDAAIKLWMAQSGGKAGGKKVEVLVKDDAGVADTTRRPRARGQ
jgi:branched-chain amino acid transport system substrate-binding protein